MCGQDWVSRDEGLLLPQTAVHPVSARVHVPTGKSSEIDSRGGTWRTDPGLVCAGASSFAVIGSGG